MAGKKRVKCQGEKNHWRNEARRERVVGKEGRKGRKEGAGGWEGIEENKREEDRWEKKEKMLTDASKSPTHAQFLCWWLSSRYEVTSGTQQGASGDIPSA